MRISLIYPLLSKKRTLVDENKQFWPPLGLAYIAAVLEKNGHTVEIIDRDLLLRRNGLDFAKMDAEMIGKLKDFKPGMVGISVTTPNMPDVACIARLIKDRLPGTMVVLGGPHVSGEPILTLQEIPHADAVVRGEGEFTALEIASGKDFRDIDGISYRKEDEILSNRDRILIPDIDALPMPARHLLDMKAYSRPSRFTSRNLNLRTTSIFTARGCPYRCNFCAGPLSFSGKVRFHSPGRVVNEIEELVSRYSIEALYFAEDMFLSSKKRSEEILGLFIEKGINRKVRWIAQAKANIITPELLELMKKAGCVGVEYGFESGSQRVLDLMNKKLAVDESIKAADLTRKARLRFQANIIVGYPGEREDDFRKTIDFIKRIRANMIGFNIFMPLPGTPSYQMLKEEGRPLPRWEDIGDPEAPQVNFADMSKEAFERLYLETRLNVILPMNLRSFLADNIHDPLRMVKIILTQFRGVVIKTLRSVAKLRSIKAREDEAGPKIKTLFLSYNGLLEPILPSQGLPYLKGLAKNGHELILLTYEKKGDLARTGKDGIARIRKELASSGIEWIYLRYHKNPPVFSTLFDLLAGSVRVFHLIKSRNIKIVHLRGVTPGAIMIFLSKFVRVKLLYDMRGLLAEEYVGGNLWKEDSVPFRLVKAAEKRLLSTADAVTTLTDKHMALNRSLDYFKVRNIPLDVVPCCVDTERFDYSKVDAVSARRRLGLEGKFVLMYPGKTGTFYFMKDMLEFYKEMVAMLPNPVFLIVTNDSPETVMAMARDIGLSPEKLLFIRRADFSDMPAYYAASDAGVFFINPYKKIGSSPIKMGEFLASGVPVIINPGIGDTEELVRKNKVGVVVEELSPENYRRAINGIMKLKQEGETLKQRCRDTAKEYLSVENGIKKYLAIYEELAGR